MSTNLRFTTLITVLAAAILAVSGFGRAELATRNNRPGVLMQDEKVSVTSGTIRSIDLQERTITLEAASLSQQFVVPEDAEIVVKDNPKGELSDLQAGNAVEVHYTEEEDVYVAHRIAVLD